MPLWHLPLTILGTWCVLSYAAIGALAVGRAWRARRRRRQWRARHDAQRATPSAPPTRRLWSPKRLDLYEVPTILRYAPDWPPQAENQARQALGPHHNHTNGTAPHGQHNDSPQQEPL